MWPFKKMQTKQDSAYRAILMMMGGEAVWTKVDIEKLTKAGYQNCCTTFACVKLITDAAAGVPWSLFRKPKGKGTKKEKIEEHPLLDLMLRPNPRDGGTAFRKAVLGFYLISGNSYLIRIGPIRGEPKELYTMRPDRTKVLPGTEAEPIRGYRYTVNGVNRQPDFEPNEVLHLKAFHPLDDWYGLSPIEVAAKEIDIAGMAREWNMKLLQNDCRPPGAFSTEGTLDDEQYKRLKEDINEKFRGYKNVAEPLLLEAGLKWESFAITPRDMDHFNSDKMTSRKICSVFGVSPELIGDAENKTYSNYKEARKALYLETAIPLLDYFRDELNNWLTPAWGDDSLILEYDKDSIDAIKEEMSAIYERQSKAWWRTINEKRRSCGDDEIGKAGDIILIPANLIPMADISGNIKEE